MARFSDGLDSITKQTSWPLRTIAEGETALSFRVLQRHRTPTPNSFRELFFKSNPTTTSGIRPLSR